VGARPAREAGRRTRHAARAGDGERHTRRRRVLEARRSRGAGACASGSGRHSLAFAYLFFFWPHSGTVTCHAPTLSTLGHVGGTFSFRGVFSRHTGTTSARRQPGPVEVGSGPFGRATPWIGSTSHTSTCGRRATSCDARSPPRSMPTFCISRCAGSTAWRGTAWSPSCTFWVAGTCTWR
jgi:hypothetical protein